MKQSFPDLTYGTSCAGIRDSQTAIEQNDDHDDQNDPTTSRPRGDHRLTAAT